MFPVLVHGRECARCTMHLRPASTDVLGPPQPWMLCRAINHRMLRSNPASTATAFVGTADGGAAATDLDPTTATTFALWRRTIHIIGWYTPFCLALLSSTVAVLRFGDRGPTGSLTVVTHMRSTPSHLPNLDDVAAMPLRHTSEMSMRQLTCSCGGPVDVVWSSFSGLRWRFQQVCRAL